MDAHRFDQLATTLAADRRGMLRAAAGAAAAVFRSASAGAAKCAPGGSVCTANSQCCSGACVKAPGEPVGGCACKPVSVKCGHDGECCSGNCKKKHGKKQGTCACETLTQRFCEFPQPVGSCCFLSPDDGEDEICVDQCGCCPPSQDKCCIGPDGPFCAVGNTTCCGRNACLPTWGCCSSGQQDICCPPLEACCTFMGRAFCCPVGSHCCGAGCCEG